MSSTAPDKRAKLIDELLGRKEFAEIWVNKWAELLQIKSSITVSYKAMFLYYNWLVEKLSKNMPMDEMVQELLGANGEHVQKPGHQFLPGDERNPGHERERRAGFHGNAGSSARSATTTRLTGGRRTTTTASRHFFSQIGRKTGEDYRETIVFNSGGGEVTHPVGGVVMKPKFLGGDVPDVAGKWTAAS